MNLAIRTDASLTLGSGHLMRCLTLAETARRKGHAALFVCRAWRGHLGELVRQRGFSLALLPSPAGSDDVPAGQLGVAWEEDAGATAAAIDDFGDCDALVVDHYGIGRDWETALRRKVSRILVVDDLANRSHDCDVLLDQNLYDESAARYRDLIPASCRVLVGPHYALLRTEFATARAARGMPAKIVRRVVVAFGGSDAGNATGRALEALRTVKAPTFAIDVVIGAANPHRKALEAVCAGVPEATLHCQVDRMADLIARADLAIGAGGATSWERCCLGVPTLAWPIADNQRAVLLRLAEEGAVCLPDDAALADPARLVAQMQTLLDNVALRRAMARRAAALCDGRGAERVFSALCPPAVHLRQATAADADDLFGWRNHPDVRRVSANAAPIDRATHDRWIAAVLSDPGRLLFIAERDGMPVAVLRFDLIREVARVSIYVVPGAAGAGIGRAALVAGELTLSDLRPDIVRLEAEVLDGNAASQALFESAGYRKAMTYYRKDLHDEHF